MRFFYDLDVILIIFILVDVSLVTFSHSITSEFLNSGHIIVQISHK